MRVLKILIVLVMTAVGVYFSFFQKQNKRGIAQIEAEDQVDVKAIKAAMIHSLQMATLGTGEVDISMEVPLSFCQKYENLEMTIEAQGVSMSGEPIQMASKRRCYEIGLESKRVTWFFHPSIVPDESYFHKNLSEPVPSRWFIKEINFYSNDMEQTLKLSSYEIIYVLGAPIELTF